MLWSGLCAHEGVKFCLLQITFSLRLTNLVRSISFCFVLFCLVSFIQIRLFSFKSNPSQSMIQNKQII